MSNSASAQVRVDIGGSDGVPHTFIWVTHPDGKQTEYGMVPATHLSPEGPGKIDITGPDSPSKIPHEYDISGPEVTLTDQQYRDLMRDIDASIKNPPGYILPGSWWPGQGTNCTGWVVDLWTKHKLPKQLAVTNKWVWNPYQAAEIPNRRSFAADARACFSMIRADSGAKPTHFKPVLA